MKYVDEYRDPQRIRRVVQTLHRVCTRPWTIMEVCGGQTHTIARFAIEDLLPSGLELIHGPGCPVCVTPLETIDAAYRLARRDNVILCSFGDMLRIPGPNGDLLAARAAGADVRIVLSPLEAVNLAAQCPDKQVVFYGVGFETTAPASAMAVLHAQHLGLPNFSVLAAHVRVPPAIEAIVGDPQNRVQAFLAAGHVCTIAGTSEYVPLAQTCRVPIVVTGFEPLDILRGLLAAARQLEDGRTEVENTYERVAYEEGNLAARSAVDTVFEITDAPWRGFGTIGSGGLRIRKRFREFDATRLVPPTAQPIRESKECRAADVLRGQLRPIDCPAFATQCSPQHPLGAPMVSSEGACAAYYRYRRRCAEQSHG